jgi:hypothetical protein
MVKLLTILLFFARSIVTPEMFGARGGNQDDWTALQAAADSVVKVNGILDLSRGYRFTRTINFKHPQGKNFTIVVRGDYQYCGVISSRLIADFKSGPAINVQNGKGSVIEGLYFEGKYKVPAQSLFTPYPQYGDPTCSDDRYNPYVAIEVDGERNATVAGSTGTLIRDCLITNFTGGIIYSPNGYTLNNELNTIERVVFSNLKFGFAGCQAQEKLNIINNIKAWNNIHTLFVFNVYGQQQPGNYYITNISIAGGVGNLVHRKSLDFFPISISNVFGEMLYSIGLWDAGAQKDELRNFSCNFLIPSLAGAFPSAHIKGNGVAFYNCAFRYYGQSQYPMLLAGNFGFVNSDPSFKSLPYMKGMYNSGTDTTYKITPVTRDSIFVADDRTAILFQPSFNVGDIVVFTEMGNNAWAGMAEVENNSGKAVKLRYISQSVLRSKKYQIGRYEIIKNTSGGPAVLR